MKHLRWTEWLPDGNGGFCWYIIPFKTRCGRVVDEGRTIEDLDDVECKHCRRIMKNLKPEHHLRQGGNKLPGDQNE